MARLPVPWILRAPAGLAERTALSALDSVLASRFADEVVKRVVSSPAAGRAVSHTLSGPLVEEIARDVARYAVMDRLADEEVMEAVTGRLLESEELWLLVEEIARSPAVTDAISHQSAGFADQVAAELRSRSDRADERVERIARRLLRRREAGP